MIKNKYVLILSIITVVIYFIYLLFFSENGIRKHKELNVIEKHLDANILKTKNETYNAYTYDQLENDTAGKLEKYAREQLNLQKPNEDVFVVKYE
jgi:cell division protein FtsB